MNKLIIILGPTATGKTQLAVNLAGHFNGEIISADSRQIYKGMDIGTAKDLKEYKKIPYHLIDIKQPNQQFTLAQFQKMAFKKIKEIQKKDKLPLLVGGSGLYISSIVDNYRIPSIKPNQALRKKLDSLSQSEKIKMLIRLDPDSLAVVDIKNSRRLNRALEICLSGHQFSRSRTKNKSPFAILQLGLTLPKQTLDKKINQRVDQMIQAGLIPETEKLIKKYGASSAPLQTIGYAEIIDYLNKKTTLEEAVQLIKTHTRQFAKRQTTWFKRDKNIHWLANSSPAHKLIKDFLEYRLSPKRTKLL